MTRPERNGPKSFGDPKWIGSHRTIAESRLEVDVLQDVAVFHAFTDSVYDSVVTQWAASHPNGAFPVTAVEFRRYSYTALRSRVARVRDERFPVRCDSAWVLPTPVASVLAQVGRVEYESPAITVWPRWNPECDNMLMTYDEWSLTSRRMRAVEKDTVSQIVFVHAIEGSKLGNDRLMNLIPVRDELGRVTPARIYGMHDVDPIAAAAYLVLGMWPELWDGAALISHPLLLPHSFIETAEVLMALHRLAETSSGS